MKQSIILSTHGSVFDFCNDRTEYLEASGDTDVQICIRSTFIEPSVFRKQILMLLTCDVNAGFTLAT